MLEHGGGIVDSLLLASRLETREKGMVLKRARARETRQWRGSLAERRSDEHKGGGETDSFSKATLSRSGGPRLWGVLP